MLHAESEIDRRAGETGHLYGRQMAMVRASKSLSDIGRIFAAAFCDAGPLR